MKTVVSSVALNTLRISSGFLRGFDGCNLTGFSQMLVFQQQYSQRAGDSSTSSSGSENTSNYTGAREGQAERKKSRTGGDMTDEGQVHTPSLGKTPSTRDIIQSKGKEAEERLKQKSQQ